MNSINNLHNDLYKLMHYSTLKTEYNIIDKFISDFKIDFDSNIDESPEYVTPTEKKNETKNKPCYENDIRIKVYNKMNREVILPDQ